MQRRQSGTIDDAMMSALRLLKRWVVVMVMRGPKRAGGEGYRWLPRGARQTACVSFFLGFCICYY